jgi:ribosomal protein S18 acetylase RimI-like enzyme
MGEWKVSTLDKSYHREAFDCGTQPLNDYIQKYALQDMKRQLSQSFVATYNNDDRILGYYSISASSFQRESLDEAKAKKLPAYPVPAAIIGRLAVDRSQQRGGLGQFLLMDALYRIVAASRSMGVYAIIVDAKNEAACSFYKRYGFISFHDRHDRLFISLKTVMQSIKG